MQASQAEQQRKLLGPGAGFAPAQPIPIVCSRQAADFQTCHSPCQPHQRRQGLPHGPQAHRSLLVLQQSQGLFGTEPVGHSGLVGRSGGIAGADGACRVHWNVEVQHGTHQSHACRPEIKKAASVRGPSHACGAHQRPEQVASVLQSVMLPAWHD